MGEYKDLAKRACCIVEGVLNGDISKVNAKELGEIADVIKDMEEATMYCEQAKYYKKVTEAMEKASPDVFDQYMDKYVPEYSMVKGYSMGNRRYPMMKYMDYPMEYDSYAGDGMTRYYSGGNNYNGSRNSNGGYSGNKMYYNGNMTKDMNMMNDHRNGRSYMSRRTYMDMKEKGSDKESTMMELEHYIQELGSDITEMLENASPEERQSAKQKLLTLSTKIQ